MSLPLLLSAKPLRFSVITAEDPYIVARFVPRPSIVLSAKETVEQFTLLECYIRSLFVFDVVSNA
jgi:hypothetical protein